MLSTTCLSSLIYPWLLTCPLWCWAPRLTVTQTTSSSGKITAISPSKHIVFWTGREITVVVHMDDFGLLLGTIKTQFVEGPSIECRRAKVKEIETANRSERKYRWANENSNLERANCPNRGKTRLAKSRLVLVLNRIGLEIGASFLYQSWKPKQSRMTFDTQLKTVLLPCISVGVIEVMKKRREIVFELLSRVNIGGVQHECVCRRQC